ncbi:MAG: cobalamin biosynthesis protein CobQ [Pseudomonadota bacterium]
MNTPTHMLVGAAVFARPLPPLLLLGALAGGLVPDLPMFVMILWSTRVLGMTDAQVFGELYFSDSWQAIFSIDHGFFVWGGVLALAVWRGNALLRAFAGSGLLHAAADFLTHNDDARRQFWPVSDWVFQSPVSYWDRRFYGTEFAMFEFGLVLVLTAWLCWRLTHLWERALVVAVATPVVLPVLLTGGFHGLHGMG